LLALRIKLKGDGRAIGSELAVNSVAHSAVPSDQKHRIARRARVIRHFGFVGHPTVLAVAIAALSNVIFLNKSPLFLTPPTGASPCASLT
jgi:hypothetical protein